VTQVDQAIVIGGGPAGLATAGELARRGVAVVVMERGEAVGDRWRSRYEGLRLNTFRGFSHLPGQRLPRAAGRYAFRERLWTISLPTHRPTSSTCASA
jgi:putative flavoprotein involved in K+ transport